jgi:hypothetical protein
MELPNGFSSVAVHGLTQRLIVTYIVIYTVFQNSELKSHRILVI